MFRLTARSLPRRGIAVGTLLALALALVVAGALQPRAASAHPLGNFTINRYSRLDFGDDAVRITYVLDYAEIPTFQDMKNLDRDGDGALSDAEARAWLDGKLPDLVRGLRLVVGDSVVPLSVLDSSATFVAGQGGLPTLRVEAHLHGDLPAGWQSDGVGGYTDRNYSDRLGWREIVIRGGTGVAIDAASAPTTDLSNELRSYPQDALTSPLDMSEATFTIVPGDGALTPADDTAGQASERLQESTNGGRATNRVAKLITAEDLTPTAIAIAVVLALFWGAVHALSPGHGKTVVAAYLVGARGTARHAAFLGLTVTITHTIGVFALGLVTLYLSRYILPETLYPWLSVISGGLVVAIGVALVYRRLRGAGHGHSHAPHHHHDHDHSITHALAHGHEHEHGQDHDHDHGHEHDHAHTHTHGELTHTHDGSAHSHGIPGADGSPVTWHSLLALGVSGGLIPCPSALVLLLASISLDRLEFGMILVVAFSLGLAVVLTGIGLLLVYARRIFERFSLEPRIPRLLPVASALAISVAGLAIVIESIGKTGIV